MKKFLAFVLAGVMVMGLSATALAADVTPQNSTPKTDTYDSRDASSGGTEAVFPVTSKGDVVIDVDPNDPGAVYNVVVSWEKLEFKYTFGSAPVWNPTDHIYTTEAAPGWSDIEQNIVVTNHSNRKMKVTASFDENDTVSNKTVNNVTATLNKTQMFLETGEGRTYATASNDMFKVTISDTVPNTSTDFILGTVYLKISDNTITTP